MVPKLPGKDDKKYWQTLRTWAEANSDGCSGVPDLYVEACWEHDYHYRFGVTLLGDPITFGESNARFRQAIQQRSKLKWFSPLSWVRFLGVKAFGKSIWDKHRRRNLPPPNLKEIE